MLLAMPRRSLRITVNIERHNWTKGSWPGRVSCSPLLLQSDYVLARDRIEQSKRLLSEGQLWVRNRSTARVCRTQPAAVGHNRPHSSTVIFRLPDGQTGAPSRHWIATRMRSVNTVATQEARFRRRTLTRVPWPGLLAICHSPPMALARWRMLVSPNP